MDPESKTEDCIEVLKLAISKLEKKLDKADGDEKELYEEEIKIYKKVLDKVLLEEK